MELPPNEARRLAAHLSGVPMAVVPVGGGYRQWFKSAFDVKAREMRQPLSPEQHAARQDLAGEVADLMEARRLQHHAPRGR